MGLARKQAFDHFFAYFNGAFGITNSEKTLIVAGGNIGLLIISYEISYPNTNWFGISSGTVLLFGLFDFVILYYVFRKKKKKE